ncbi:phosphatidylserine/phosphatidylglycerophosphate/cardiolipin synthase family protein [uncultured Desulfovibrio sp.]|uniref:phospholipase D-like domain-containing protein n=1 Tax=uncultured Desulfovibrio sp. TaxID=167968 RepID=UPI002601D233|nr:phospholipase D-like domain-containing protein [uncultured Desulfovibrio sp.]
MLLVADSLGLLAIHILSWIAVCHALLTKHDPRAALGWTVAALLLPLVGPLLYACFGISRAESRASRIMRRQEPLEPDYAHPPFSAAPPEHVPESIVRMEHIGRVLTEQHLCGGNALTPLHNGDEAYPAMLAAIREARDHVFLCTYIFNAGRTAQAFNKALAQAAARGVDVRLLVDGIGVLYSLRKPWKKLPQYGVKVAQFLPPSLFPPNLGINLRNHRKMLICDSVAFTGGMNIADDNLTAGKVNYVQDMHFSCEGPIVDQLRRAFLLNWGFCTGNYTPLPPASSLPRGDSRCRIIMDGPGSDADILNDVYCGVISAARTSVRIMTPYFLPSHGLVSALRSAGQRGVDVRVALPAKNNLFYVHWAQFRLLPTLLEAGVRVWLQPPPFAHTKLLAVDGYYAQIGSANLDARSLRLNFELNMEVFDPAFNASITGHIDHAISRSLEITAGMLETLPLPVKLRNAACWIFSPYL